MTFVVSVEELVQKDSKGLLSKHESWGRVALGEVANILNGFPFASDNFSRESGTPLIRIRDVLRGETETYYQGKFEPQYLINEGDLLVGMDGDFNSARWRGRPSLLNQRVCKISSNHEFFSKDFLSYVLPGYLSAINAATPSLTVKHLSSRTISEIPLPLPPIGEQSRIATKLDELFSDLDASVAALERARANLKRYRASVLKAAVEGRLTAAWRRQNPPAETSSQLLERILAERRRKWEEAQLAKFAAAGKTPPKGWKDKYPEPAKPDIANLPELPEGWCWASIEQLNVAERPISYGVLQPGEDVNDGVPLIRVCDVADGVVNEAELKKIAPAISEQFQRTIVQGGEVLLTIVGTIGRTAIVPPSLAGANTARAVAVIPVTPLLDPRYLELNLRETGMRARLTRASHEVARKTLNLEDVRPTCVPLAPADEQLVIVEEIDVAFSSIEASEGAVEAGLLRTKSLRQSILKRAFEGKLVPQDPKDESASVLLERIRATRAGVPKAVARRGRKPRNVAG